MQKKDRIKVIGNFHSKSREESLYYQQFLPDNSEIKAQLVVLHDVFDYHKHYLFLEDLLPHELRENLAISWFDFKGHGLSSGTRGHVDDFDEYVEDLEEFLALMEKQEKFAQVPLILFGQGMGALTAIRYHQLNREREAHLLSGMILINPLIKMSFQFPDWLGFALGKLESPFSHLKWPQQFSGKDFLTQQLEIEKYDSDPLILDYLTIGTMKEIQRVALEVSDAAYFFDFPCLLMVSELDKMVDPNMTKLFAKGAPKSLMNVKSYEEAQHGFLHESVGDKALKDVYNWIKMDALPKTI